MKHRDTFAVPVENRIFEVGREITLALGSHQETEVMDETFCLCAPYAARCSAPSITCTPACRTT